MPSKSPKQARTMEAAAHDPEFAAKMGIPQSVAQEYNQADKGTSMLHKAISKYHRARGSHGNHRYSQKR